MPRRCEGQASNRQDGFVSSFLGREKRTTASSILPETAQRFDLTNLLFVQLVPCRRTGKAATANAARKGPDGARFWRGEGNPLTGAARLLSGGLGSEQHFRAQHPRFFLSRLGGPSTPLAQNRGPFK